MLHLFFSKKKKKHNKIGGVPDPRVKNITFFYESFPKGSLQQKKSLTFVKPLPDPPQVEKKKKYPQNCASENHFWNFFSTSFPYRLSEQPLEMMSSPAKSKIHPFFLKASL